MRKAWLKDKLSMEEYKERQEKIFGSLNSRPIIQKAFVEKFWKPFIENLQEGDEIWTFRSPDEDWDNLCGRAGDAILRDGEIVYVQVTELN